MNTKCRWPPCIIKNVIFFAVTTDSPKCLVTYHKNKRFFLYFPLARETCLLIPTSIFVSVYYFFIKKGSESFSEIA